MIVKDLCMDCDDIFSKAKSTVPVAYNLKKIHLLGLIKQA